jgi:putative ABC transport system permease protein
MKTPLAWKNLTSSWNKCALAAAGVGFAVVLMFMQIGFKNALIDNNVQVFTLLDVERANISVISRSRYSLSTEQRFPKTLLEQLAAQVDAKVQGTVNIERGYSLLQLQGLPARPIRVIAVDSGAVEMLKSDKVRQDLLSADEIDGFLVDTESKSFYGFASNVDDLKQQTMELNSKAIQAAGFFRLGTDFSNDGSLLMSQRVHAGHYPWRSPNRKPNDVVDIGLLSVQPESGKTLDSIARELQAIAGNQAIVLPTRELIGREKKFWSDATPIGKIFTIGTLMGLIVGAIICYQIQFTDIADHMPEFATLKAMGYSGGYFWRLILAQSFYLAFLGFLPGIAVSYLLYQALAQYSGLIMMMTWDRVAWVWGLTLVMCCISGALAIRKLFRSDPASLF